MIINNKFKSRINNVLINVFKCGVSTFVIERIAQIRPIRARQLNFSEFNTHLLFSIAACVRVCVLVGAT